MGNVLETRCPECGRVGSHEVVRTDPRHYIWSERHSKLIEGLWGRGIWYRVHIRRCYACGEFETIEMDHKILGQLMGELDHLMERSKWQSRVAEKEMEASAERIVVYRRGADALLLLCELLGEKAEEVPGYERLREIVQTVDDVVATLPPQARAIVAERYGLSAEPALSDVGIDEDRKLQLSDVLRGLKHPARLRRLRQLMRPDGWGQ
jgi:hypothetical protein